MILMIAACLIFFLSLKRKTSIGFPSLENLPQSQMVRAILVLKGWILPIFIISGIIFLVSGITFSAKEVTRYGYGSDIVVVLDESASMGQAFSGNEVVPSGPQKPRPSKISAAKQIIRPFIQSRKDRLALVIFGEVVVPIYPLSFNQEGFLQCFDAQTSSFINTLIDLGLAQALEILRQSSARTKIILLISDGDGRIEDGYYQLSNQMKELAVRFYWIAVDHTTNYGSGPNPTVEFAKKLNPSMTRTIPVNDITGLTKAFEEIGTMERSLISYKEKAEWGVIFFELCWILLAVSAVFCALETIHND